ncbi:MAG: 4-alpha-glucanotransferase [Acidobacteria bacterium]|nr:4-alpha-glucanotransferase [Acidobacteriota bacterium]
MDSPVARFDWEDGTQGAGSANVPADAPFGYHTATLENGETATLIVCPPACKAAEGRVSGVAISLYSLRSQRNQGCGDFTDLKHFCTWAAKTLGAGFLALNPLHAIPNRQPYNTSPYLPTTTLFRNFLYLDVARVPGCPALDDAKLAALRAAPNVEYEQVAEWKLTVLRECFAHFAGSAEFDAYRAAQGESLRLFATYCALYDAIHGEHPDVWLWQDWPEQYRDPASPAVGEFAAANATQVLFYEWLQWLIDIQLADAQKHAVEGCGMSIGLYHDLALAVDRSGFDAWAFRDYYIKGCRVGSPPDDFAPEGQDWSFPPPNTAKQKASGYKQFIATIRNNCQHGGALRLDHVMRLFRLFWIPDGFKAADGTYVHDNAQDLLRILALESLRNNVLVIGEDLGTITEEMRAGLHGAGILSYRLLYFERRWDGSFKQPGEYPEQALVCTTTHDLPTIAGFWTGHDIDVRRSVGLILDDASYQQQKQQRQTDKVKLLEALYEARVLEGDVDPNAPALPDKVRTAIFDFLRATPSKLFAFTQDDLTGFPEQQNMPGTTWQYPNWRHKMPVAIEDLPGSQ